MASTNPAFKGLVNAMQPNTDDPLGINLKRRGMDAYYEEARKSDPRYASGPLPDPAWEGLLQAMHEAGVTKVGQDVARPMGIVDNPDWQQSGDVGNLSQPVNPNSLSTQDLENMRTMRSTNIATPTKRRGR